MPIIFWWTPSPRHQVSTNSTGTYRTCGLEGDKQRKCFFTNVRLYRQAYRSRQKSFIFEGAHFHLHDLPLPRRKNDQWALIYPFVSSPSSKINYLLAYAEIISMFNHTATFSRHSDMSLVARHLTTVEDLMSDKYVVTTSEKNRLQREEGLAPVVYVESNCNTPSDRDTYVKALMRYIRVDSYGKCLNNR